VLPVLVLSIENSEFSVIYTWHLQGAGDYNTKLGITILGENVTVEDEVVVVNCIVLPHKTINRSVQEEIIL
jgi:mannose-1-phosphate guanylyltransferase